MTLVSERSFNAVTEQGWGYIAAPGTQAAKGSLDIFSDPTAPKSPNNVGRATFPAGLSGDGSSSSMFHATLPMGNKTTGRVYIAWWFKLSPNWYGQDGSSVDKILWAGQAVVLDCHGGGYSDKFWRIALQGGENFNGDPTHAQNQVSPTSGQRTMVRDTWYFNEFLIHLGTPGVANGELHMWLNGVKTHQFTGRNIHRTDGSSTSAMSSVRWHPIYGGQNGSNVPETQYQYIDHIRVSQSN